MKIFLYILAISLSFSCAHQVNRSGIGLLNLTSDVNSKQKTLDKSEFKNYLLKTLDQKTLHLEALRSQYQEVENLEVEHQDSNYNSSDIQQMKLRSSQIQLHNMNDQIKDLEKQIFFLKSKLSALP